MKPLVSRDYPLGHLLNPATPYEPAARTDIARTFERVRREALDALTFEERRRIEEKRREAKMLAGREKA